MVAHLIDGFVLNGPHLQLFVVILVLRLQLQYQGLTVQNMLEAELLVAWCSGKLLVEKFHLGLVVKLEVQHMMLFLALPA